MGTQITPVDPIPLKHRNEIIKLNKELIPLNKMEQNAKGRLLSIKEATALSRKTEILDEIHDLEQDSREWFEPDDVFESRLKYYRTKYKQKEKQQQTKNTTKTNAYKTKPVNIAWSTK